MMRGNLHHHLKILAGRFMMIMVAVLVSMVLVGVPLTHLGDTINFHPKIMILEQMGSVVVCQHTEAGQQLGVTEDVEGINKVLKDLMGQMDIKEVHLVVVLGENMMQQQAQVEGSMMVEAEIEVKTLEGVVETEAEDNLIAEAENTLMEAVVEANLMVGAEVEVIGVEVSLMVML